MEIADLVPFFVTGLIFVIPFWAICSKVGIVSILSLAAFIPVVGVLIVLAVLAFAPWPNATARGG
jgi:hypothetical protein